MKTLTLPLLLFILTLCLVTMGIISVYSASSINVYRPPETAEGVLARAANPGAPPSGVVQPRHHADMAKAISSRNYLVKQIVFAAVGLALMLACYMLNYHFLKKYSFWIMAVALVMCGMVFLPVVGSIGNKREACRWINLGFFRFQPSELARLALVIYMAKMLSDRRQFIKSFFSGVMPALIITGIFALVIDLEPDFGAAFVLCAVIFGMWLAAEMRWFHLIGLCLAAVLAAVVAILWKDYRIDRVLAFITYFFFPERVDKELLRGILYQLYQSLTAVGSGGLWGLGLGESHQKYSYLTEAHTDFIFAIMCEEMGFVRITLILILYCALILLGWRIASRATDLFGSLLASGITLMIFISAAINMSVVLGLLPTKGLVLPFFSAGGSSLLVCMAAMGILMNIARNQIAHETHGRHEGD